MDTLMITGVEMQRVLNATDQVIQLTIGKLEYRTISNEGLYCVIKDGKYGFIDSSNKVIIPFQFDGADNFYDSIAIVKIKNKFGAINHKGILVIPCEYDLLAWEFGTQPQSFIYANKNNHSVWINTKGEVVEEF
jgi:hypothetical protein